MTAKIKREQSRHSRIKFKKHSNHTGAHGPQVLARQSTFNAAFLCVMLASSRMTRDLLSRMHVQSESVHRMSRSAHSAPFLDASLRSLSCLRQDSSQAHMPLARALVALASLFSLWIFSSRGTCRAHVEHMSQCVATLHTFRRVLRRLSLEVLEVLRLRSRRWRARLRSLGLARRRRWRWRWPAPPAARHGVGSVCGVCFAFGFTGIQRLQRAARHRASHGFLGNSLTAHINLQQS